MTNKVFKCISKSDIEIETVESLRRKYPYWVHHTDKNNLSDNCKWLNSKNITWTVRQVPKLGVVFMFENENYAIIFAFMQG